MPFPVKDWQDGPSTSTPISAAALENMETRLSDWIGDTYQSDFSPAGGTYMMVTPAVISFHSGTFTPKATEVVVDVDIVATKVGYAHNSLFLFAGPTGAVPLAPTTQTQFQAMVENVADGRGVKMVRLGSINTQAWTALGSGGSSAQGPLHARFKITGLTPGTPVAWEIGGAVVGPLAVSTKGAVGGGNVACAGKVDLLDFTTAVHKNNTNNTATVFRLPTQPLPHSQLQFMGTVTLPAGGGGDVAVAPDGQKAVCANYNNNTISVVNTGGAPAPVVPTPSLRHDSINTFGTTATSTSVTNIPDGDSKLIYAGMAVQGSGVPANCRVISISGTTVTLSAATTSSLTTTSLQFAPYPTLQATYTLPNASSNPLGVAITPDGLTAWICLWNRHEVIPMTIATGVFGTAISWAAAAPFRCAITPDGTKLLVAGNSANTVRCINIPAGTTAWTSAVTLTGAYGIAVTPDGLTTWVMTTVGGGNGRAYPLKVSDGTAQTVASPGYIQLSTSNTVGNPVILPDNLTMFTFSTATGGNNTVNQWTLSNLANYTQWGAGSGKAGDAGCVSPQGDIVFPNNTDGLLHDFPGGMFIIRTGIFHNELARIVVQPAT